MKTRAAKDVRVNPPNGYLDILVSEACIMRALRIMDTLIKQCTARGWPVSLLPRTRGGTIVRVNDCELRVMIIEFMAKKPRDTGEIKKALELPPEKRPIGTLNRMAPTGRLTLQVECVGSYDKRGWRDARTGGYSFETELNDVLTGMEEMSAIKLQRDKAEAEAEKLRQEEEKRKLEHQKARQAEQARVDKLLADAEKWDQSQKLRKYIDACQAKAQVSAQVIEPDNELGKWFNWAREQANRLDPLAGSPRAFIND
ncbi:MAG: hypothetical protein WCP86_09715 [bacterium]